MKTLVQKLNESKSGDLFQIVADCISGNSVTDKDVKKIIQTCKSTYGFELSSEEAKALAEDVIKEFPELLK